MGGPRGQYVVEDPDSLGVKTVPQPGCSGSNAAVSAPGWGVGSACFSEVVNYLFLSYQC